ncbi:MAG: hypothetical protein Q9169_007187 [Polycauliona sp. 2 TL-2023]
MTRNRCKMEQKEKEKEKKKKKKKKKPFSSPTFFVVSCATLTPTSNAVSVFSFVNLAKIRLLFSTSFRKAME